MGIDIECKDCAHATKTGYSLTCDLPNEIECDPMRRTIPQESQTTAQVKAATLRAVGEWLIRKPKHYEPDGSRNDYVIVRLAEIEALRNGQMPAGWEKE